MSNLLFGHKNLYINGQLNPATNNTTFEVICPGTEKIIATISWATKEDTLKTLKSAQEGFENWSQLPISERVSWMSKLRSKLLEKADTLRTAIVHEMGKTWEGSEEDITSITNSLQFYADEIQKIEDLDIKDKEGTHKHTVIKQPLGVAVAFLAYNFPLLNLGFKLGPALAAGCSIILKPSEFSPISAYLIGEICEEINFPKGVINVICGDLENVGIPLCESTIPQLITMIGSTKTAQKLIEQSSKTSIKQYSMECGGNAPFIVCEDANLENAINIGSILKTANTGQICVAPNRFYVHESVIDTFISGMKAKFENTKVGFGKENKPDMGPLANKASVTRMVNTVAKAIAQGGEIITGGKAINTPGYFFEPTAIKINNPKAEILTHEVFGPIALIVPFKTKEEVLQWANNTDAGLASYVFTENNETQKYFSEKLAFGEVQINGVKYDIYLPHGGIKNSGIGVDCSEFALEDYLIRKRISIQL
ncbi:succinate-semialdehyde dehydrogenase/glutarate-semialdehyde dehydrogenase [Wenyingzhuangia heitensis]|uniref:Succinate-semialdehyde dehydrogenase/glutarate-semialdehyde dehydrogenase n=1 Tax=Wenyingzhuangia heitensis TaxID=1487859 RepID=A0ABX0U907_9FLAO|nr:aldehyde dehydrogenase family protein [Wenyingzhuangia heitensis]NIJ45319.1 succinate-semialdehyde dehydrogenase/glutarate-semialdehyde dehydrogenase [Wenyingzhuangia heitensis]